MKALKVFLIFIIAYFILTAVSAMNRLVVWVSQGNIYVSYGMYALMGVLFIIYILVPILDYMNRPSLGELEKLMEKDPRAARRVRRHLLNMLEGEDLSALQAMDKKDIDGLKDFVKSFMIRETDAYDKVIQSYAYRLTSTVLLSPNAFIDGLAILFGNSSMIYELSKRTGFRYSARELFGMYFSVMSIASVSGLFEEFDDELEEIIETVVEEFSTAIGEESGKSVSDIIPVLNIMVKASSILFQAAANYAFIIYNGKRFKYRVRDAVEFGKKTEMEIRHQARREARKSRYVYVQDMIRRISTNSASGIKGIFVKKTEEESGGIKDPLRWFKKKRNE